MKTTHTEPNHSPKSQGFTIVELLVAMAVFSTILLVLTLSVISIARLYDRGIVQSNTQNTTRNIQNEITQAIQFSPTGATQHIIAPNAGIICAGGTLYAYLLGAELNSSHTEVLRSVNTSSCNPAQYFTYMSSGRELMGQNMRLAAISVGSAGVNLYKVSLRIVYGDNDLVCSPSVAGDCSFNGVGPTQYASDLRCKLTAGSQFCDESNLTSIITTGI
jgi:prepilin-type N-terminal cleavage/methylation domain-containing protein